METLYRDMLLIRRFEERVLELFSAGKLSGTTHTCIGQEIIPVMISKELQPQDIVWSNHRGHGHYLARTGDVKGLLAEIMGHPFGICGGRGGSQHLCNGTFFSNGILGSTAPIAAGMALSQKLAGGNAIVVLYLGDGAMGEGVVYETLNMIGLWRLPILLVIEDNHYAQTTSQKQNRSGTLKSRVQAFSIGCDIFRSDFRIENAPRFIQKTIDLVRGGEPHCLIFDTYRLSPHSKGDDYRPLDEMAEFSAKDPLRRVRATLEDARAIVIETEIRMALEAAENEIH